MSRALIFWTTIWKWFSCVTRFFNTILTGWKVCASVGNKFFRIYIIISAEMENILYRLPIRFVTDWLRYYIYTFTQWGCITVLEIKWHSWCCSWWRRSFWCSRCMRCCQWSRWTRTRFWWWLMFSTTSRTMTFGILFWIFVRISIWVSSVVTITISFRTSFTIIFPLTY